MAGELVEIAVEALIEVGSSGKKGCAVASIIVLIILAAILIYFKYY